MYASGSYIMNNEIDTRNYKVGMYLRLSKADDKDDNVNDPSQSIVNQRELINRYILDNGWDLYDEYIDDGYSGTNFDRPDFQRMTADIEQGKINLVIVKDLSRLGRNVGRTTTYIEEFLPLHNVRFIAINNNIDSFAKNNSNNELIGMTGFMNDWYCLDISKKIRSTFNSKRQEGQFIGAFAPYGYLKDPNNKNKLIIDPEASLVIKRIFNMRINGTGNEAIMRTLNAENIPCPTKYKEQKGMNYKNVNIKRYLWTAETIKSILSNPTYIGNMAQRRNEKINYKLKKFRKVPRKDWIIVENTHEPIIDKETFQTVQELLKQKAYGTTQNKTEHFLGGLLVCGECGKPLTFRRDNKKVTKDFITLCSSYTRFSTCTRHAVLEEELNDLVIKDLKSTVKKVLKNKSRSEFLGKIQKPTLKIDNNITKIIAEKEKRKNEIVTLRKSLYEDWKKGKITEEDYDSMYEDYNKEKEQLNNEIEKLQLEISNKKQEIPNKNLDKLLEEIVDFKIIPKTILVKLIEKVEVFEDKPNKTKSVKVHYKFPSP